VLLLSQAIRRMGRPSFPVPSPAVALVAQAFRRAGLVDFSPEQMRYLEHGRVADVTRLAQAFGWSPRPTAEAFDDFVQARAGTRAVTPESAAALEASLLGLLSRGRAIAAAATTAPTPGGPRG
jgi:UDP-glucose 4-epimerase